jgi:hypothetical protein
MAFDKQSQWLYKGNESKLFNSIEKVEAAQNGWVDCPTKTGTVSSPPFDYKGKTAQELADNLTVKELRVICKDLGIEGMSKALQAELCKAIVNHEA